MTRTIRSFVAALAATAVVAFAFASASAQAPNAHVGTWKINLAKSKFVPGPGPQSQTVVYAAADGGLKLTADGVDAKGAKTHSEYTAKFDGKPVAFTGNANADMVTIKQIDPRTIESVWTLKGKATLTIRSTVAAYGKSRTTMQTGTDAAGQKVNSSVVYDRQ